jgi:AbiV family abortive infection protein
VRVHAIKDLSQLSGGELFRVVGLGLQKVFQNANRLFDTAQRLGSSKEYQGFTVLRNLAEEEAAKFLILLDAIRCPRTPLKRFSEHLDRFNDHFAKGLYSRAYKSRPDTPADLQQHLDAFREEYYLDGPNGGVDWIFRNEIRQGREQALYVDYISTDDGHAWLDPGDDFQDEPVEVLFQIEPPCLKIARSLSGAGISETDALKVVTDIWPPASIRSNMTRHELLSMNKETLKTLESRKLLREQSDQLLSEIINDWQYPLYDLNLKPIRVGINSLRERQDKWNPDY